MEKIYTVAEKLLIAANSLDGKNKSSFTAEDLVVEAHKLYPNSFALRGYIQYPDSNRVFAEMMGQKPLKKNGWLIKVGAKMYRLSDSGRILAQALINKEGGHPSSNTKTNREIELILERLIRSKACHMFGNKEHSELIFQDACAFWDIAPTSVASTLSARLSSVNTALKLALDYLSKGITIRVGATILESNSINLLVEVNEYLQKMFDNELNIIRSRTDDRSKTGISRKKTRIQ